MHLVLRHRDAPMDGTAVLSVTDRQSFQPDYVAPSGGRLLALEIVLDGIQFNPNRHLGLT